MSMAIDRSIRRLTTLERSASTARVLNLLAIHKRDPDDPELLAKPFFENRVLNRCIILKHRLRPHEQFEFSTATTSTATWTGLFTTKIQPPKTEAEVRANPLGVYIHALNWSKELG